ncbi:MAG: zinc-binding protein [Candidatus Magasanikbacteria bacterium]|nr:zinc-binding protein [Candidatus Magasanikbacteria bacterium]
MYPVNEKCAGCGVAITELPFQPTAGRPVYCTDCNRQYRDRRRGGGGGGGGMSRGPRQMYAVDLQCAGCGTAITELPFQPTGDRPVYCRTCLAAKRGSAMAA